MFNKSIRTHSRDAESENLYSAFVNTATVYETVVKAGWVLAPLFK
jgi:hypothetical protein